MKKFTRVPALLLALCAAASASASPVDAQTAAAKAKAFIQNRIADQTTGVHRAAANVSLKQVEGFSDYLYAFNVGDDEGYVILSADDNVDTVLGYSDKGSIDVATMPDALKFWLKSYEKQIKFLADNNLKYEPAVAETSTADGPKKATVAAKESIEPLVTSHWSQGRPWNYETPTQDGTATLVGCVPLAMAQIMYHYKYPATLPTTVGDYAAGTAINWDLMTDWYSDSGSETDSEKAVSQLCHMCGVAVDANYGTSVTTAWAQSMPGALQKFGYSQSQYSDRGNTSDAEWVNRIYSELSQGRPVAYVGYVNGSTGVQDGHCWVCDGYSYDNYFHMNWGFGNMGNGYYLLTELNPGSATGDGGTTTGNGYSGSQGAVFGITYPGYSYDGAAYTSDAVETTNAVTSVKATVDYITSAGVRLNVTNSGDKDYSGVWYAYQGTTCLGGNGIYVAAGETKKWEMSFASMSETTSAWTTSTSVKIIPTRNSSGTAVASGRVTTLNTLVSACSHVITAPTEGSYVYYTCYDDNATVTVKVTNTASGPAKGYVHIDLWDYDTNMNYVGETTQYNVVTIPANTTENVDFTLTGLTVGHTYSVVASCYDSTTGTYDSNEDDVIYLRVRKGMRTWAADGTATDVAVTAAQETVTIPEDVVAAYLSRETVAAVVPNSNPNTLYYLSSDFTAVPDGLEGKNVIMGNTAASIKFSEQNDASQGVYVPKEFTAEKVAYARQFTKAYGMSDDPSNAIYKSGWNTISLPFAPTEIKSNGKIINWFKSSTDNTGRFWLYRFDSEDTSSKTVGFGYTDSFKANTPYLIAVPGDSYGDDINLCGQNVTFTTKNATLSNTTSVSSTDYSHYKFVGTHTSANLANIYAMNATGENFEYSTAAQSVLPFHAYFNVGAGTSAGTFAFTLPDAVPEPDASYIPASVFEAPVLNDAAAVTASGFTVDWNAIADATSYELSLTGTEVVEAAADPTLVYEDFVGCNNGGSTYGGTTIAGAGSNAEIDASYTRTPGWTGNYVYTAPIDAVRIGSTSRTNANITTPSISAPESGKVTIAIWSSQYDPNANSGAGANDGTAITVKMDKKKLGSFTPAAYVDANRDSYTPQIYNVDVTGDFTVSFTNTDKKRSIIYYIGVYDGTYTTAEEIASATNLVTKDPDVVTATYTTTDTSYTFDGLLSNYLYTCKVRAISDAETTDWSNSISVTLDESQTPDGIGRVITAAPRHEIYNLAGQRMSTAPEHGVYIIDGKKVIK